MVSTATVQTSAAPVTPFSITLRPIDGCRLSALARWGASVERLAPVSMTKRNGPLPLTMTLVITRPMRSRRVGAANKGSGSARAPDRSSGEAGTRAAKLGSANKSREQSPPPSASSACNAMRRFVDPTLMADQATPELGRKKQRSAKTCGPHGGMSQFRLPG